MGMDDKLVQELHQSLLKNVTALNATKEKVGFTDEIITKFKIGYCTKEKRLMIPVYNGSNKIANILKYKPGAKQYKWLPYQSGIGRLLFPCSQLGAETIYIVAGPKDALNVIGHWGLPSVTNTTGESNWNDEWSEYFKGYEVIICYDYDEAGRKGALRVAQSLHGVAASVKIVIDQLPYQEKKKKDLTDLILDGFDKQSFLDKVFETELWSPCFDIITLVDRNVEDNITIFQRNPYRFVVVRAQDRQDGMKAQITLENMNGDLLYRDSINISKSSQRKKFNIKDYEGDIDADLVKIEDQIRKLFKKEAIEALKPKQSYIITEKERSEAEAFLKKTPYLLNEVLKTTTSMGVVGEETNRLLIYLVFTSRMMREPLSLVIKGESASGKSYTSQKVMELIPEEGIKFITRATAQAFYHLPRDGMKHKTIVINELPGSESADYAIRSAQSEGNLILSMPVKDPVTGNIETIEKVVEGPVGFLVTTTKGNLYHENETRNFSIFTDDSPKQTRRIREITIKRALGKKIKLTEAELTLWRNIQRILKQDLKIIIPFAKEIFDSFPDKPIRVRRDQEKFRVLIEVITVLHQYHRHITETEDEKIITATLADYHIAKVIGEEILFASLFQLPRASEEVFRVLQETYVPQNEWSVDDVMKLMGWEKYKVYRYLRYLVENEYIIQTEGFKKGQLKKYRLSPDLEIKERFLIDAEDLIQEYPCNPELFYNPLK